MNIYKISQDQNNDYDTYDSAIVVAKNADEARRIHPSACLDYFWHEGTEHWMYKSFDGVMHRAPSGSWANHIDHVNVLLVGKAAPGIRGVLVASFNAG